MCGKVEVTFRGRFIRVPVIHAGDHRVLVTGRWLTLGRIEDEWYKSLDDPYSILERVRQSKIPLDIFSFWQIVPNVTPRFSFLFVPSSVICLP